MLKLVDYLPVHTLKPYTNLHVYHDLANKFTPTKISLDRTRYSYKKVNKDGGSDINLAPSPAFYLCIYSKICLKRPLKIDKT